MASVAIGEAIGDSTGDEDDIVSFFCRLEPEAATLASAPDLFLEDAPPQFFTILRLTEREIKRRKGLQL